MDVKIDKYDPCKKWVPKTGKYVNRGYFAFTLLIVSVLFILVCAFGIYTYFKFDNVTQAKSPGDEERLKTLNKLMIGVYVTGIIVSLAMLLWSFILIAQWNKGSEETKSKKAQYRTYVTSIKQAKAVAAKDAQEASLNAFKKIAKTNIEFLTKFPNLSSREYNDEVLTLFSKLKKHLKDQNDPLRALMLESYDGGKDAFENAFRAASRKYDEVRSQFTKVATGTSSSGQSSSSSRIPYEYQGR